MHSPQRSSLSPPPLPREHGAWVMLLLPLVLGSVLAGAKLSAAWLLPPAVVLVFLSHCAILPVAQRKIAGNAMPERWAGTRLFWAAAYFVLASVLFVAVVILTPDENRIWLLFVSGTSVLCGAAYTAASCARAGRLISAELLGMAAMSLSAPMMALAAEAPVTTRIMGAAAMAFAYSASTLAYVRAYTGMGRGRVVAISGCVAAHAALLGGLALLGVAGRLSPWWFIAFIPVVARTAWGLARPPRTLRAVGLREIWVALWFTAIAAVLTSFPSPAY
jgi:hypothetical protein